MSATSDYTTAEAVRKKYDKLRNFAVLDQARILTFEATSLIQPTVRPVCGCRLQVYNARRFQRLARPLVWMLRTSLVRVGPGNWERGILEDLGES